MMPSNDNNQKTASYNVLFLLFFALIALAACAGVIRPAAIQTETHPRFSAIEETLYEPLDIELMSFGSLDEINRYVNQSITYTLEAQGQDKWQEPNQTLNTRKGDCEDYALLKMALIQQRFPGNSPQILIVRIRATGQMHAVLVIQFSSVLDNQIDYALDLDGPTFQKLYQPLFFVRSSL